MTTAMSSNKTETKILVQKQIENDKQILVHQLKKQKTKPNSTVDKIEQKIQQ